MRSSQVASANRLQLTTSVAQAQPTTPCAGSPSPKKVNQMDSGTLMNSEPTYNNVTNLGQPRGLVERAVNTKQKGWRQGQRQNGKVVADLYPQGRGHFCPSQQRDGGQQDRYADERQGAAQVERLAQRAAHDSVSRAPRCFAHTGSNACRTPISAT